MLDTAAPSQISFPNYGVDERRVIGRALRCWDALRDTKPFPDRELCLDSLKVGMSESIIVIAVGANESEDHVIHCGTDFRNALACNPVGQPLQIIMPSTIERGLVFWRVTAEMKKPIADVGSFTNANGDEIMYRSVFLPVTDDGGTVSHLIGAFSYKTVH